MYASLPAPTVLSRVPGVVQAAAIVTWVCCAITVLLTLLFLVGTAFVGSIGLTLGLSVAAPALHALLIAPGAGAVLILLFLPSADVWFRGLAAA